MWRRKKSPRANAQRRGSTHPDGTVWQTLWFSTLRTPWDSLAIVPAQTGLDPAQVADAFVAAGRLHGARTIRLLSAQHAGAADVQPLVDSILAAAETGECIVVALDAIIDNPASIPIACAASATLVLAKIGESRLAAIRATVDAIGRERVIGSIAVG
jgi:hypothetical protein